MRRVAHHIGGSADPGEPDRSQPVIDPATGAQVAEVPLADAATVDRAVAGAVAAQRHWRLVSLGRRQEVMFAMRSLVRENRGELAAIVSAEHGKTLADADGEITRGLEVLDFACGIADHLKGEVSTQVSTGVDTRTVRHPLGVIAGITPFNFPVMVPMWMHPIAIATGNAFVLKPSERDPSASELVAELYKRAGLPDGIFNVVHGDRRAVDRLLVHPDVAAVSFVGSTPVARYVYATAAAAGKRVQALGGAKNHMVVLADADLTGAADAAISAAYGSAGERCMAVSVVVVEETIADQLATMIAERAAALRVGPGDDPANDMGPLITAEHRERVVGYVASGVAQGAVAVLDGRARDGNVPSEGFFIAPTLLDAVAPHMDVYRDEVFGPVLALVRVAGLDEALDLINASPFGNGAALFTSSGESARRFEAEAEAGMIGVNLAMPVPVGYHSFGGWNQSSFGSSGIYGPEGVRFYTRSKVTVSRWGAAEGRTPTLAFGS